MTITPIASAQGKPRSLVWRLARIGRKTQTSLRKLLSSFGFPCSHYLFLPGNASLSALIDALQKKQLLERKGCKVIVIPSIANELNTWGFVPAKEQHLYLELLLQLMPSGETKKIDCE